jgi:hypothetical protein
MKRTYCDCCENEITDANFLTPKGFAVTAGELEFKVKPPECVIVDYDVCKYCVITAIAKLDDRPRDVCKNEITIEQMTKLVEFIYQDLGSPSDWSGFNLYKARDILNNKGE